MLVALTLIFTIYISIICLLTRLHVGDCLLSSYCKTTVHFSMILATGSWSCGACASVSICCASSLSALRSTRSIATFRFSSLNRYIFLYQTQQSLHCWQQALFVNFKFLYQCKQGIPWSLKVLKSA